MWGGWRSGADTGDPAQRYCASLGHVADDESSMIYMRARYYEPLTGRFISEDPAMDGANWFVYCWNEPVLKVDPDGRIAFSWAAFGVFFLMGFIASALFSIVYQGLSAGWGNINWSGVVGDALTVGVVSGLTGGFGAGLAASGSVLGEILLGYATGTTAASIGLQAIVVAGLGAAAGALRWAWDGLAKVLFSTVGRNLQAMMLLDSIAYD